MCVCLSALLVVDVTITSKDRIIRGENDACTLPLEVLSFVFAVLFK